MENFPSFMHAQGPQETKFSSNVTPSPVVFVFNLMPQVVESDLHDALSPFGRISYVLNLSVQKSMALVEFEQLESAQKCVESAKRTGVTLAGHPVQLKYSMSQAIRRLPSESMVPNRVLLISISNVKYLIDVSVIHQICCSLAQVLRISISRGLTVQAHVELESEEAAKNVKNALNGADIYEGCCTLRVEFASVDHVRVDNNDGDHWDFEKAISDSHYVESVLPRQQRGPPSTFPWQVNDYNNQRYQSHFNRFARGVSNVYNTGRP